MRSKRHPSGPRGSRPAVEQLESRQLLAVFQVSGQEQLFIELLNNARANPAAYGVKIGVDLSSVAPAQPLAINRALVQAAQAHSRDMNDRQYFDLVSPEGTDPGERISQGGFAWSTWNETVTGGPVVPGAAEALQDLITDADVEDLTHRKHLLAIESIFQADNQIGVGIVQNGTGPLGNYYTVDTAAVANSTLPYVTGVVFIDANANGEYDVGEGVGGATVTVRNASGAIVGTAETFSSGGYSIQAGRGRYTAEARGGVLAQAINHDVTVGGSNVRVNFVQASSNGSKVSDLNAWVGGLYRDVLGREGSAAEIALYTNAMLKGMTREAVAVRFVTSDEYGHKLTEDWFQTFLGRNADPAARTFFSGQLKTSHAKNVLGQVLGSREYFVNHDATNEGFVTGLYQDLLGRDPVGAEAKPWIDKLANRDRNVVAAEFLSSAEATGRVVDSLYDRLLYRGADTTGRDLYVNALTRGADDRSVLANILISNEYFTTTGQTRWLQQLYLDALGRDAEASDLSTWLAQLRKGTKIEVVAASIADSPEAHERTIGGLYQDLLGREADSAGLTTFRKLLVADGPVAQVVADIVASPEYYEGHQADNEGFVRGLYADVMNRSATDAEVAGWLTQLNTGKTRTQVALGFTSSDEFYQLTAERLFMHYLYRSPYTNELVNVVNMLKQGVSEAAIAGGLLNTADYVTMAVS